MGWGESYTNYVDKFVFYIFEFSRNFRLIFPIFNHCTSEIICITSKRNSTLKIIKFRFNNQDFYKYEN